MGESGSQLLGAGSQVVDSRALKSVIDSALERGSDSLIALADSAIGISLDARGDWTISIRLSVSSDRFHLMSTGLEELGFFQATESEGISYFLWTSLLAQAENVRATIEHVLSQALRVLQAVPVSSYIS